MASKSTKFSTLVKREVLHSQLIEDPWDGDDEFSLRLRHDSFKKFLSRIPRPGHGKYINVHVLTTDKKGNVKEKQFRLIYTLLSESGPDGTPLASLDLTSVCNHFVKHTRCKVLYNDKVLLLATNTLDNFVLEVAKETCWVCHKETDDSDPTLGEVYVCDGCDRSVHSKCAGLTRKLRANEDFYCTECQSTRVNRTGREGGVVQTRGEAAKRPHGDGDQNGGVGHGGTVVVGDKSAANAPGGSRDGQVDTRNTGDGLVTSPPGQANAAAAEQPGSPDQAKAAAAQQPGSPGQAKAAAAQQPGPPAAGTEPASDRVAPVTSPNASIDAGAAACRAIAQEESRGRDSGAGGAVGNRAGVVNAPTGALTIGSQARGARVRNEVVEAATVVADGAASAHKSAQASGGLRPPASVAPSSEPTGDKHPIPPTGVATAAAVPGNATASEPQPPLPRPPSGPRTQQQQRLVAAPPTSQPQGGDAGVSDQVAEPGRLTADPTRGPELQPPALQEPSRQEPHQNARKRPRPHEQHKGKRAQLPPAMRTRAADALGVQQSPPQPPQQQLPQPQHEGHGPRPEDGQEQVVAAANEQHGAEGDGAVAGRVDGGDSGVDAVQHAAAADNGAADIEAADAGMTARNPCYSHEQPLRTTAAGSDGIDQAGGAPICVAAPRLLPTVARTTAGRRPLKTARRAGGRGPKPAAEHGTAAAGAGPSTSAAPALRQPHNYRRSSLPSDPLASGQAGAAGSAAARPHGGGGQPSAHRVHGATAARRRPQVNEEEPEETAAADDPDLALLLREFPLPLNGSEEGADGADDGEALALELPPGVPECVHAVFETLRSETVNVKQNQLTTTRRCQQAASCWKRLVALYGRQKVTLCRRTLNLQQQLKQQARQLEQQGLQLQRQADELQAQRLTQDQQLAQQVQAVRAETQGRIDELGLAVREAQVAKQTQELRAAAAEAEINRLQAARATAESAAATATAAANARQADLQRAQEELAAVQAQYRAEQEARQQIQNEVHQLETEVGRLQTALVTVEGAAAAAAAERDAALSAREAAAAAAAAAATAAARQGGVGFIDPYGRPFTPRRSDLGTTSEDDRIYIENLEDTICRLQADVTRILDEKTRIMAERSAERADMEARLMRWQQMARRRTSGRPPPDVQQPARGRMGPPPPPNRQQYQGQGQAPNQYNYMGGGGGGTRGVNVDIWQADPSAEEQQHGGEQGGGGGGGGSGDPQMQGGEGGGGFTDHASHGYGGYGDGGGGGGEGYRHGSGAGGSGGAGHGGMGGGWDGPDAGPGGVAAAVGNQPGPLRQR